MAASKASSSVVVSLFMNPSLEISFDNVPSIMVAFQDVIQNGAMQGIPLLWPFTAMLCKKRLTSMQRSGVIVM